MKVKSSFGTWRLLTYSTRDPYENMALDETLLLTCNKGIAPPTLRFYTWDPPAISLGYAQNHYRGLNIELCKDMGLALVRRISGGRAILHHDGELTYALIFKKEWPMLGSSVLKSYKMINKCLVNAFQRIGIKAELRSKKDRMSSENGPFCFLTPANNDIIILDKKVVGSAQRRLEYSSIQHGSILVSPPGDDLIKAFEGLEGSWKGCFTWLNQHLPDRITTIELQKTIQKSFENDMGIRLEKDGLMGFEIKLKERLLKEKYLTDEWNLYRLTIKS